MQYFSDLGLSEPLLRAVSAEGYTHPTPIQVVVIPAVLAQQDVLATAQTGTGKTAAFTLPLLHRIGQGRPAVAARSCRALILAPTRELALQIADSIRTYGRFTRHSVAVVVGGARPGPQVRAMAQGVDFLVATPGRLLDHVSSGAIRLDGATTLVLDEADQMLDLGFVPAIRRIMAMLPPKRQTILLSATMPKPIRMLARDFLHRPAEIAVAPASKPIERIDQKVLHVNSAAKREVLIGLLRDKQMERAIVFTRTKRGADKVNVQLQKSGLSAASIHGNKSQSQRVRALNAFRTGKVAILVATDIAARGIDVDDISHIINYELPNVPEAYVHRIGRTARAGKSGFAVSLCDHSERPLLRDIERLIGRSIEVARTEVTSGAPDRPPSRAPRPERPRNPQGENGATRNKRRHGKAQKARRRGMACGHEAPDTGLARMLGV